MPTSFSRISTFVRRSGRRSREYAQTIIPELGPEASARLGQAFGVIAADADDKAGDALVAHIEDAIGRAASEASARAIGTDRETLIEHIVRSVNHMLDPLFSEMGLPIDRASISAALAFTDGKALTTILWGNPSALLLRAANPGSSAGLFDLVAESRGEDGVASDRFAEIISGPFGGRDRILLCTGDVLERIEQDSLISAVSTSRSDAAATLIGDAMASGTDGSLALTLGGEPAYLPFQKAPKSSMDELIGTASRTSDIMSPPLFKPIASRIGQTFSAVAQRFSRPGAAAPAAAGGPQVMTAERPMPESVPAAAQQAMSRAAAATETVAHAIAEQWPSVQKKASENLKRAGAWLSSLRSQEERSALLSRIRSAWPSSMESAISLWNPLSKSRKMALVGVLAIAIAFNAAMLGLLAKNRRAQAVADYENSVAAVQQKIDAAESSLIYNDTARAKTLLDEAAGMLAVLPGKTADEQRNQAALATSLSRQRQSLRRETPLAAPQTIATLPEGSSMSDLIVKGANFWAATASGELYRLPTKDPQTGLKKMDATLGAAPSFLLASGSVVLLGDAKGRVLMTTDAGKSTNATAEGVAELAVTDAAVYSSALYVLDAPHNRIVKFPVVQNGFGKATFSLKDSTDVSGAASLAIDGSIFAIGPKGAKKLTKGTADSYAFQEVEPAMTDVRDSHVAESSDALYVLDGGRILKFSRNTGRFMAQYTGEDLKAASSIVIDEKAKTITAAAGNRILRYPLP